MGFHEVVSLVSEAVPRGDMNDRSVHEATLGDDARRFFQELVIGVTIWRIEGKR
jgi:hypothetical protein